MAYNITGNNIQDRYRQYMMQRDAYSRDPKKSQQYANDTNSNNDRYLKAQAAQAQSYSPSANVGGNTGGTAQKSGTMGAYDPSVATQMAVARTKIPDILQQGRGSTADSSTSKDISSAWGGFLDMLRQGNGSTADSSTSTDTSSTRRKGESSPSGPSQTVGTENRNQPISLEQLLEMINSAPEYQPIETLEEKFQNPEQLSSAVQAIMGMLEPQTAAQEDASRVAYNKQMQNLAENMASSGLLRSGGYASKREQGARDLASNLAAIRANQQANAVPMAMQFGQLGMQEQAQRFGQDQANWQNQNMANQQKLAGLSDVWGKQFGLEQFDWQKYVDDESLKNQRAATAAQSSAARAAASAQNAITRAQLEQANNQFALEQALQEANLTGFYNGNPTMAYNNQAWGQLMDIANQTGYLNLPGTGGTGGAGVPALNQQNAGASELIKQLLGMG